MYVEGRRLRYPDLEDPNSLRSLTTPTEEATPGIMGPILGSSVPEAWQKTGESPAEDHCDRWGP